jgi:hypothetical protein
MEWSPTQRTKLRRGGVVQAPEDSPAKTIMKRFNPGVTCRYNITLLTLHAMHARKFLTLYHLSGIRFHPKI